MPGWPRSRLRVALIWTIAQAAREGREPGTILEIAASLIVKRDFVRAVPQGNNSAAFKLVGLPRLLLVPNFGCCSDLLFDQLRRLPEFDVQKSLHQFNAVAGAAPGAYPSSATPLVVEAEAVLAAANWAGTVPVRERLARNS
jgi:hypothetical protein